MKAASDREHEYDWAVCEVKWFAVMQEDGSFEHHNWEGVVFLKSNPEGKPGLLSQLQKEDSKGFGEALLGWIGDSRNNNLNGSDSDDVIRSREVAQAR